MRWVVGTGRCGLHNYTALNNGWIQSRKDWKENVLKRYHGEVWDKPLVESRILKRKELPYYCITDCAQFMFIDLIRKLDKTAHFVWIQRKNRPKHIESFMNRVGEDSRIHPKGWEFKADNKRELIEWYIDEVTRIICDNLKGADYEKIWTEDMPRADKEDIEALRRFA